MRYEWYLAKFQDGLFIDSTPHAMSRSEADNLFRLATLTSRGFSYQVVHTKELKKLKESSNA